MEHEISVYLTAPIERNDRFDFTEGRLCARVDRRSFRIWGKPPFTVADLWQAIEWAADRALVLDELDEEREIVGRAFVS